MIDPKLQEIAIKLGQFYMNKNNGDWTKAVDEIYRLHIKSIAITGDNTIVITLGRVGRLIGIRGANIDAIEKFFNGKIKIMEDENSILDYVIPQDDYY